VKIGDVTTWPL